MNETNDRDDVIARSLATIRVPDHDPRFWDDLDARIDGAGGVVSLTAAARRPRRVPRMVLAAAAVVAIAGAALLLRDGDAEQSVRLEPADPGVTTTAPPAPTAKQGAATPDAAVEQWLQAVGEGRVEDAADLTGPRTEAYIAALGANLPGVLTEAGEGYGGWAGSDHSTTEIDLGVVEGVESAVVAVSGDWRGEGEDGFRVDAIPVTRSGAGGTWLVEFSALGAGGGRVEVVDPAPGEAGLSGTTPDAKIRASAPTAGTFWFSLDDGQPVAVRGVRQGGVYGAEYDPLGDMASQTHLLVVAHIGGDAFTAFAGTFLVEG